MLRLLKNKNYKLLFIGNLVSNIGSMFYTFSVMLYIYSLVDENAIIPSMYIAIGGVVLLVITPIAGVVVDRVNKVRILYLTDFIRGFVILLSGVVLFIDLPFLWVMVVLFTSTIVLNVNGGFFSPAAQAIIPEIVEAEDYQTANSMGSLVSAIQSILGVALAGLLFAVLGIEWIFIINGVSFIISGVSEMFIHTNFVKKEIDSSVKKHMQELKDGFLYMKNQNGLLGLMVTVLIINFVFSPVFAVAIPYLFKEILFASDKQLSLVEITVSVGVLLGSFVIGMMKTELKVRSSSLRAISGMGILFLGVTILMYGVINNHISFIVFLIALLTIMFVFGLMMMYVNVPFGTGIQKFVEPEMRGRVYSLLNTMSMAGVPIAIAIGGVVIDCFGVVILSFLGVIIFGVNFMYLLKNKNIKSLMLAIDSKEIVKDS